MKERKNRLGIIMSLFIAFIMITSVIGYMVLDNTTSTVKYRNYKFTQSPDGWTLQLNGKKFIFSYLPEQLENIKIPAGIDLRNSLEIDTTYDTNSTYKENIAESIYRLNLINNMREVYQLNGFTTNYSSDFPVITCEDNVLVPTLYFRHSGNTNITSLGNCVIIESREGNFLPVTERIAYQMLNIMD